MGLATQRAVAAAAFEHSVALSLAQAVRTERRSCAAQYTAPAYVYVGGLREETVIEGAALTECRY